MTESRPPYQAGDLGADGFGADGYDANGLDRWGVSRERKERAFAKLAKLFEQQPDTMAALLVEYRRQEGMTQESLLAKLEISPEQYSHLALCLVPDPGANFGSDLNKIVAASGANLLELATICRQVYALRDMPVRPPVVSGAQTEVKGTGVRVNALRSMAARDRQAKALHEEGSDYAASVNAAAAAPAPLPSAPPPSPEDADDGGVEGERPKAADKDDEDTSRVE